MSIWNRLQTLSDEGYGLTLRQIAARHRVSVSTARKDLKFIRKQARGSNGLIFIEGKLWRFQLKLEGPVIPIPEKFFATKENMVVVHVKANYTIQDGRHIHFDGSLVVPNDEDAINAAETELKKFVSNNFGKGLANAISDKIESGTSEVDESSTNEISWSRDGKNWIRIQL